MRERSPILGVGPRLCFGRARGAAHVQRHLVPAVRLRLDARARHDAAIISSARAARTTQCRKMEDVRT